MKLLPKARNRNLPPLAPEAMYLYMDRLSSNGWIIVLRAMDMAGPDKWWCEIRWPYREGKSEANGTVHLSVHVTGGKTSFDAFSKAIRQMNQKHRDWMRDYGHLQQEEKRELKAV